MFFHQEAHAVWLTYWIYFEGRSDGICGWFRSQEVRKTEASKRTPRLGPEQWKDGVTSSLQEGTDFRYEAERHVSFLQNLFELDAGNTRAGKTDCPWSL